MYAGVCSTPTIATISIALLCQHFYTDISHETMELLHLILQTLIELCVGNYLNQKVIYNRQIMDVLNAVLQYDIRDCVKQTDDHIQNVNLSVYVFLSAWLVKSCTFKNPCNPQQSCTMQSSAILYHVILSNLVPCNPQQSCTM